MSDIRNFNSKCFDELSLNELGKTHELRTALQLVRKHASLFSAGFVVKRLTLVPTIYAEFKFDTKI
jgi:hypothetical protein